MHRPPLLDAEGWGRVTHTATLRRFGHPKTNDGVAISALHPAHRYARSIFASRIFDPSEVRRVLKDGHQSRKIGKTVMKGPRRGWPIFTLTLEERATCPRTCLAWSWCYGNSMHAAERIVAGPDLEAALSVELADLQRDHSGGFMVRLHILGDFYSEDYVRFWTSALDRFPALHIFGFTARLPGTPMGDMLWALTEARWDRFAIRFSGLAAQEKASVIQGGEGSDEAIPCPAQTGKTETCGTCCFCWNSTRSVAFARH
jgi:hypothetical protein